MFVVALSPSKSHYYVLFIYHVKNIGQVSPNWPIFRNRDIVYCNCNCNCNCNVTPTIEGMSFITWRPSLCGCLTMCMEQ